MSEKSATTYTLLHLRFKLRVWKIWILQQKELEMGGMYLFANRERAEAYLNHPVTQAVRSNLHKPRVRHAIGFLLTAFSNATPHTFS
jgi:Putative mono-oxygenase ydhR